MHFSLETIFFLITTAFVAGCIDALAGGGGLLTIPALMAAGIPPVSALATNKLQSTIGTFSAFLTFLKAGHVDIPVCSSCCRGIYRLSRRRHSRADH